MATYTTQLSAQAKPQHLPLGQALREYAGSANRDKLLSLLVPVQRAAEKCPWLKPMIEAAESFPSLLWCFLQCSRLPPTGPVPVEAGALLLMPPSSVANLPPTPPATP